MRSHTLIFTILLGLLAFVPQQASAQSKQLTRQNGGAAQSYQFTQQNGAAFVAGTTDIGLYCDDCTTTITLPFAYELYGTFYTEAVVSSNGNIQFSGDSLDNAHTAIPIAGFSDTIFLYQADLVTNAGAGQGIFTSVSGVAPDRVFNIEWRTVLFGGSGAPDNIFEIRLFEGHQTFTIVYGPITSSGELTTVGMQMDGTDFTQYEFEQAGTLSSGRQVTFTSELAPTSANVSISGQVLGPDGLGVDIPVVRLTGDNGLVFWAKSDSSGEFRFDEVPTGQIYILRVKSRRYTYDPQVINLNFEVTGLVILPTANRNVK